MKLIKCNIKIICLNGRYGLNYTDYFVRKDNTILQSGSFQKFSYIFLKRNKILFTSVTYFCFTFCNK